MSGSDEEQDIFRTLVGFQIEIFAATGLASSHSTPFLRVSFTNSKSKQNDGHNFSPSSAQVQVFQSEEATHLVRQHGRIYTAIWNKKQKGKASESNCTFFIPKEAKYVDLQLWNGFEEFDLFLGTTRLSLKKRKALSKQIGWYPLQMSNDHGLSTLQMSIQARVTNLYDAKDMHSINSSNNGKHDLVDPTFRFTKPFLPIEWSRVVSTSIRHLFFHGDVERLHLFREEVLYGDITKEVELHIHEHQEKAFQMCQFAAQYVDNCVAILENRSDKYTSQLSKLQQQKRNLLLEKKKKNAQKRQLQKEAQDLDLLLKSYEKILELQGNKADIYPNKTSNDSPSKRNRVIEAKKPTFLMSYEEREEERKMLKQLTREQRIEDEKKRFLQLFQQKNAREQAKDLYLSKMQLKRHQASRKIQRWIRKTWRDWSLNERVRQSSAATRIQAKWKSLLIYRKYPARLREFKRQKELKLMSIEERMMRQFMAIERKIAKKTVRRDSYDINLNMVNELLVSLNQDQENDKEGKEEESVKPHVLVEYWRKLRRIFILANEKGSTFQFLFEQLDLKRDKIIDRSEFRLGLKQFGVPITRQLTRALITLLRRKAHPATPPLPLHLNIDQFKRGFDLKEDKAEIETLNKKKLQAAFEAAQAKEKEAKQISDRLNDYKNSSSDESNSEAEEGEKSELQQAQEVVKAMHLLRERILEAATNRLAFLGKSKNDYKAFRDVLLLVFEEFDTDHNGELSLEELKSCMSSCIHFDLSNDQGQLVQEFFSTPGGKSNAIINISEFLAFAFGYGSDSEEDLGLVGCQVRDFLLQKIKDARKKTKSMEEAVRMVFKRAFPKPKQLCCSTKLFLQTLQSFKLGLKSSQLGRLIVRFDRDGDGKISLHELLLWLKLEAPTEADTRTRVETMSQVATSDGRILTKRGSFLSQASIFVKKCRQMLCEMAGIVKEKTSPQKMRITGKRPSVTILDQIHQEKANALKSLFGEIDVNTSGKINVEELIAYFEKRYNTNPELFTAMTALESPKKVGEMVMEIIDSNGNGVITLSEWMEFLLKSGNAHEDEAHIEREEEVVIVQQIRNVLLAISPTRADPTTIIEWFQRIPGFMKSKSSTGSSGKVRMTELKKVIKQFPSMKHLTDKELDTGLKKLDTVQSGWIHEAEFTKWLFPTKDVEEIVLVLKNKMTDELVALREKWFHVYFDSDKNGIIAKREIQEGFQRMVQVFFTEEECAQLIKEYDQDHDGFLNAVEFQSLVEAISKRSVPNLPDTTHSVAISGFDSDLNHTDDASEHHEYEDDSFAGSLQSSLSILSPPKSLVAKSGSNFASELGSASGTSAFSISGLTGLSSILDQTNASTSQEWDSSKVNSSRGVEYSEDFDEN